MQLRRAFALVLGLALPAIYIIAQSSGTLSAQLVDVVFMLFTGSCTVLAFIMILKVGAHGRLGLLHVGMFTCMLLIFLGAVTSSIYTIILGVLAPFPSVADALNFLGYASVAIFGLRFLWYFRSAFSELQFKLTPLLGVLVAGPKLILTHPSLTTQVTPVAEATWLAYPILDGLLVVLAVMVLLLFNEGKVSSSWRWLAVGMALITIADVIIGIGNIQGWSQLVQPFYLFYFWGYICIGLGFSLTPKFERLQPLEPDYHKAKFMRSLD